MPAAVNAAAPLGLLGGSFDPVHAGHLALARAARARLGLAQVVFLPAGQPWQKPQITPAQHRLAMLQLAVGDAAEGSVDAREINRAGPSYTIDTLRELRQEHGPERPLVWLLGLDQLRRLDTWHCWQDLSTLAHLAYTARPGTAAELPPAVAAHVAARRGEPQAVAARPAGSVVAFAMRPVDCSATRIRTALAAGREDSVAAFLAPPVRAYIHTHQLYTAAHGQ